MNYSIVNDFVYGDHSRQRLDIYQPLNVLGAPVLIFFHGGGFIRGDKTNRSNIGQWGASQGWVTILANYRLAPENNWPSGPNDVVAAWQVVQHNARDWGADPNQIFLMGESAGAAHVAAASLMRRFQPPNWAIKGALLLSGPYNAGLEAQMPDALQIPNPDIRNTSYFGSDKDAWQHASIVNQVDVAPFPLLIAAAEKDLLQMQIQAGELFSNLVQRHGFKPDLHWWPGHDHFMPGASIGGEDTTVSKAVAKFVSRELSNHLN